MTDKTYWVIAYDIRDNRRRAKVARKLERAGLRVQKSVFLTDFNDSQVRKLVRELGELIEHETDQVAAWPLRHSRHTLPKQTGPSQKPQFQESLVW